MAQPKLTEKQISRARLLWERDARPGHQWLIRELNLNVSLQAVRKIAVRDGWQKLPEVAAKIEVTKGLKKKAAAIKQASSDNQVHEPKNAGEPGSLPKKRVHEPTKNFDKIRLFGELTPQEELFIREYMVDFVAYKAAQRAGYQAKNLHHTAYQLLRKPLIKARIEEICSARAKRLGIDADTLMALWAEQIRFDANEIVQFRRVCCPFCYSEGGEPQQTPEEYFFEKAKWDKRRLANPDLPEWPAVREKWWDKSLPPNPECRNCHGDGVGEMFIKDSRQLSPLARLMYCGVRPTSDGSLEVVMQSKEKAADNLAKALGLFREREEKTTVNIISNDDLAKIYFDRIQNAKQREKQMCDERGIDPADDVIDIDVIETKNNGNGEEKH